MGGGKDSMTKKEGTPAANCDSPLPTQSSITLPSMINPKIWNKAEKATSDILQYILPTLEQQKKRIAIVDYVRMLICGGVGTEVLPCGSVPLKTYLADADIDLTVISAPDSIDSCAGEICSILEEEVENENAMFKVTDVEYLPAEVRVVKCLIEDIAVDISFNQFGGISSLLFLEEVNGLIGKNSLFKRSIILIKAWCHHEGRILGARNGLVSSYALETLILYIFQIYHSSLDGPFAVLYRFFDYYSKFDWDSYGISLYGPISLSSLPELVAVAPENDGGDLLFNTDFIRNNAERFLDTPRGIALHSHNFQKKYLNIVDPIKENNNLGQCVGEGKFYRICSAFRYGANNLGHLLLQPTKSIAHEIRNLFRNTMKIYERARRPMQNELADLSEDHKIHLKGLLDARRWQQSMLEQPIRQSSPSWCSILGSLNISDVYSWEDLKRPLGTGAFLTRGTPYEENCSGSRRYPTSPILCTRSNSNVLTEMSHDSILREKRSENLPRAQPHLFNGDDCKIPSQLKTNEPSCPASMSSPQTIPSDCTIEFGPLVPVPMDSSTLSTPGRTVEDPNDGRSQDTFELKSEDDFPPIP